MEYEKAPEVVLSVFDTPKQNSYIVCQRQCVLGSSFSVSLPNNKPTNKVFFFYSVLESAVVNISSS